MKDVLKKYAMSTCQVTKQQTNPCPWTQNSITDNISGIYLMKTYNDQLKRTCDLYDPLNILLVHYWNHIIICINNDLLKVF